MAVLKILMQLDDQYHSMVPRGDPCPELIASALATGLNVNVEKSAVHLIKCRHSTFNLRCR